jgi:hydroxymethylglutaryl-CoA lyase
LSGDYTTGKRPDKTMTASDGIEIVECPRDALQGCCETIPSASKAELLRRLIAAGFRKIDAVSFVSPRAVPQMADAEKVLALLGDAESGGEQETELIGIVLNRRGVERAAGTKVRTVGFPLSVSPTFQWNNAHQTIEQAFSELQGIKQAADAMRLKTFAYISMAFGNPYGDEWRLETVTDAAKRVREIGIGEVLLADTAGMADAAAVARVFEAAASTCESLELGLHLHARYGDAAEKVRAGIAAGCRRFDTAIGGMGGCPFAGDRLVGNIPTEIALKEIARLGRKAPVAAEALAPAAALVQELRGRYGCA